MTETATALWNRHTELTDLMHTAPTAEERKAAKQERLALELSATYRHNSRQVPPEPPTSL